MAAATLLSDGVSTFSGTQGQVPENVDTGLVAPHVRYVQCLKPYPIDNFGPQGGARTYVCCGVWSCASHQAAMAKLNGAHLACVLVEEATTRLVRVADLRWRAWSRAFGRARATNPRLDYRAIHLADGTRVVITNFTGGTVDDILTTDPQEALEGFVAAIFCDDADRPAVRSVRGPNGTGWKPPEQPKDLDNVQVDLPKKIEEVEEICAEAGFKVEIIDWHDHDPDRPILAYHYPDGVTSGLEAAAALNQAIERLYLDGW